MPREYEALLKEGYSKESAAKIYNSKIRPKVGGPAMGRNWEKRNKEAGSSGYKQDRKWKRK